MVRLDFGTGHFREPGGLHANVIAQLDAIEEGAGLRSEYATAPERLAWLIAALHRGSGQRAVVLVDEYDKPILDALKWPEVAEANRAYLVGLYWLGVQPRATQHRCASRRSAPERGKREAKRSCTRRAGPLADAQNVTTLSSTPGSWCRGSS